MNRNKFLKNIGALSLSSGAFLKASAASESAPFKSLFAPHFGQFENSAGKDFLDQLQFMSDSGFQAFEDNQMMNRSIQTQEDIGNKLSKLSMKMGVFVVWFDNWPLKTSLTSGDKEWQSVFLNKCKEAVEVAKRVNAKYMTVVPGNFDRNLPLDVQTANVIDTLKRASEIFEPHNLTMVLEPLSDNPDLFLRNSTQTYLICKSVNSPACKILFDMYHMQRNEGRLTYHMDLTWSEIGYFQIGDVPGRKEPTTGEINYKFLFQHIAEKSKEENKTFILGMEHGNSEKGVEGEKKLIEAYRYCDSF